MTKQEAKDIGIEVWTWLRDNPTKGKEDLPLHLVQAIAGLRNSCHLCALYCSIGCSQECPLKFGSVTCYHLASDFHNWMINKDTTEGMHEGFIRNIYIKRSMLYASKILQSIKDWKID